MLKGLARDLFAFPLRKSIAKRNLEITQRNFTTVPVQDRHQPAESESKAVTALARQQRHEFRGNEQASPLQPVADSFPNRTHSLRLSVASQTPRSSQEPSRVSHAAAQPLFFEIRA